MRSGADGQIRTTVLGPPAHQAEARYRCPLGGEAILSVDRAGVSTAWVKDGIRAREAVVVGVVITGHRDEAGRSAMTVVIADQPGRLEGTGLIEGCDGLELDPLAAITA